MIDKANESYKQTLQEIERAIRNEQSRDTGNIKLGHKTQEKDKQTQKTKMLSNKDPIKINNKLCYMTTQTTIPFPSQKEAKSRCF